jgi:hypothetical protein
MDHPPCQGRRKDRHFVDRIVRELEKFWMALFEYLHTCPGRLQRRNSAAWLRDDRRQLRSTEHRSAIWSAPHSEYEQPPV